MTSDVKEVETGARAMHEMWRQEVGVNNMQGAIKPEALFLFENLSQENRDWYLKKARVCIEAARPTIFNEAIEAAAKVAEETPEKVLYMYERPGSPPGNQYVAVKGQKLIAQSIRSLKLPEGK